MSMAEELAKGIGDRRRLHILQYLRDVKGYMAATSDIQAYLAVQHMTTASTPTLLADIVRLRDLGLVHELAEGTAAKLTKEGLEAANGVTQYPGVARPLPE
jgi:hypothetical protein